MSLLSWLKQNTSRDDAWITVHPNAGGKGSPVLLDDEGYIKGGMGGKFTGQRIDLMPRQNQGLRKEINSEGMASASTPGFLRTHRYNIRAPRVMPSNVASQATTGNQNGGTIIPNNSTTFTRVESTFSKDLSQKGVQYNEVQRNQGTPKTEDEVIRTLGGGDETKGSCASLGLAYIGQKNGWDVGDFRGGESLDYFANGSRLREIFRELGATVEVFDAYKSNLANGKKALASVQEGKQYYFLAGKHAAIVRRKEGRVQYLELQSSQNNGWKDMENLRGKYTERLTNRFGCSSQTFWFTHKQCNLIDISQVNGDKFRTILGYINTPTNEQKKGASGYEK